MLKKYIILTLSFILFSCSGSNKYIIKNCNCDLYKITINSKCALTIDAIYSFNENELFTEIGVKVKNKGNNNIFFNTLNNILKSPKFTFKNITKDSIIKIEPNDSKSFNILFWGKLTSKRMPLHDEQILSVNGLEINNEKTKIEDIILVTTSWKH